MGSYGGYRDEELLEQEGMGGRAIGEANSRVVSRPLAMPPLGFPKPQRARSDLLQQPGVGGAIARFWARSYAPDYVGLILLEAAYLLIQFFVEPFHRMFSLDDRSKSYPHASVQRVSVQWNLIYAGLVPCLIILAWTVTLRLSAHQTHVTILGLFISHALASFLTDVIKNAVGRSRPDLIARCKPAKGTPGHELVTIDVCTETDHHTLHDGWRSFPSGHSSFAFAGLGFLALFFAGQLHIFRPRADLARVLLALAPLIGAALIAISRLEDYRHDVYDVTTGSILGMAMAYFSYRRYYPSLRSVRCNEPYPSRAAMALLNGAGKPWDEERNRADAADFALDDLTDDPAETDPLRSISRDGTANDSRDPG